MISRPLKVAVWAAGPEHHGVVVHMTNVATALRGRADVELRRHLDGTAAAGDVHHLAFTDSLYDGGLAAATAQHLALAKVLAGPTVVTLHDLPRLHDGHREARRADSYRSVVAAADHIIVCTPDEADRATVLTGRRPTVIPLPIPTCHPPAPLAGGTLPTGPAVGVLGWVFPGKGHDLAIDVAAAAGVAGVVVIGAVAPHHVDLARALSARASASGVRWHVTGHLDDDQLLAAAATVRVPVAAYEGTSASASLRSWITAGRVPLAVASDDARSLIDDDHLHAAGDRARLTAQVLRAVAEPAWTRSRTRNAGPDVAAAHLAVYRAAVAGR